MYIPPLFQQLFVGLAIMTSMGTLVQDTKVNKALEMSVPLVNFSVNLSSHLDGMNEAASAHTHVEIPILSQQLSANPRVQARDDHRRYVMPKYSSRSNSQLGDSQILWPNT